MHVNNAIKSTFVALIEAKNTSNRYVIMRGPLAHANYMTPYI